MGLVSLVCAWIVSSPFLWAHSPVDAVVTVVLGMVAWVCSLLIIVDPRFNWGVTVAAGAIAFSGIAFAESRASIAGHLIGGVLLLALSLPHQRRRHEVPAHLRWPQRAPLSADGRRFVHGLGWGAAAAAVMGVVTLVAVALPLWPLRAPLPFLLARHLLGDGVPTVWLAAAAIAGELAYGAICGGLLTTFSEKVDLGDALALGLLRWLATQLLVLPALGWDDFGLAAGPALLVATALPHLVYALALWAFFAREDRRLSGARPLFVQRALGRRAATP
jgi:hypothetical protein